MERENKRIIHVLVLMCLLFLSLIVFLTYFEFFVKDNIMTNSYNRRQWEREDKTVRGSIYDRNGVILAESTGIGSKSERTYPYGALYSHVIGYNSKSYGRTLIEHSYNNYLLDIKDSYTVFDLKNRLSKEEKRGNDVHLSLDHKLQTLADGLMKGKRGAVVAMQPNTGEILAMVSKPDFDPNSKSLSENWRDMVESEEYPFLPRATQGLYAPGSTYKVVISAAALENGLGSVSYIDKGKITIEGKEFRNFGGKAYGDIDLKHALAVSSNVVFSQLGVELGSNNLKDIADRMGIGKVIPFDISVNQSRFPYSSMGKTDMASVGIGQGKLLVTPLHMAMITSCIANNGVMMSPILVNQVMSTQGKKMKNSVPETLYKVMSPKTALEVKNMMKEVVVSGTGKSAAIKGVHVAGKTGTAENEITDKQKNKEHAWFIGFAPAEDPKIAVAVILEYSGSTGGKTAAPIAQKIMAEFLGKK